MKPRVLITRVLPEPALEVVRQACEVQLDPLDQPLTPSSVTAGGHGQARRAVSRHGPY